MYKMSKVLPSIRQGWKIHISAFFTNKKEILNIVKKICFKKNLSFKYIKNKKDFNHSLSKVCEISQVGKYITIYPSSIEEFEYLVLILYKKLKRFKACVIPGDISYKKSIVHYRFGSFIDFFLYDEKGNKYEDKRSTFFIHPSFNIDYPNFFPKNLDKKIGLLNNEFLPIKIISQNAWNSLIIAKNKLNKIVLIKMSNKYLGYSEKQTTIKLLNSEYKNLVNNKKNKWSPKPIKKFFLEGNLFLVKEYIIGKKIETVFYDLNKFNKVFLNLTILENFQKEYCIYIIKILNLFIQIKKNSYFNLDFSVENIILNKNFDLYFIDQEFWSKNKNKENHIYDFSDLLSVLLYPFLLDTETLDMEKNKLLKTNIKKISLIYNFSNDFIKFLEFLSSKKHIKKFKILNIFYQKVFFKIIYLFDNSKNKKNQLKILKKVNCFFKKNSNLKIKLNKKNTFFNYLKKYFFFKIKSKNDDYSPSNLKTIYKNFFKLISQSQENEAKFIFQKITKNNLKINNLGELSIFDDGLNAFNLFIFYGSVGLIFLILYFKEKFDHDIQKNSNQIINNLIIPLTKYWCYSRTTFLFGSLGIVMMIFYLKAKFSKKWLIYFLFFLENKIVYKKDIVYLKSSRIRIRLNDENCDLFFWFIKYAKKMVNFHE